MHIHSRFNSVTVGLHGPLGGKEYRKDQPEMLRIGIMQEDSREK
jgi:hypothetical protein